MKEKQQFELKDLWLNFLNYGLSTLIFFGGIVFSLYAFNLFEESRWMLTIICMNITTLLITAFSILGFVHYKNSKNHILMEQNFISMPIGFFFPDTKKISFDDVIFENRYSVGNDEIYSIVYNGGSVELKKSELKFQADWKKLVYELKEVIH